MRVCPTGQTVSGELAIVSAETRGGALQLCPGREESLWMELFGMAGESPHTPHTVYQGFKNVMDVVSQGGVSWGPIVGRLALCGGSVEEDVSSGLPPCRLEEPLPGGAH